MSSDSAASRAAPRRRHTDPASVPVPPDDRSSHLCFPAGPMCSDGGVRLFLAPPDAGSPLAGAARRNHCSAARATPSFTGSENTGWGCGLSATPAFFELAGVNRQRVRQLTRRHVRREAPRQIEPTREVQRVGQRRRPAAPIRLPGGDPRWPQGVVDEWIANRRCDGDQ